MATTNLSNLQQGHQQQTARRPKTIFDFLDDPRVQKGIGAVAGKFLTPDRFLRLAINAVKKTPLLAQCDPQSVLGSFMASAALGLEPNTVQQQAFLIPYKKRAKVDNQWVDIYECQFQIGYRGFITLAHRSPHIASVQAEAIHDGDLFDHMLGSESFLKYRKALKDRGGLIGSFCYTKLESGIEMATVLPLSEVEKIRGKSETYNALMRNVEQADNQKDREKAEKKLAETPWVMWEDDMAAKSAIKKHAKQLPLMPGDAMSAAAEIDSNADRNVIDMSAMADPDVVRGVVQDGYSPPAIEHQEAEHLPADLGKGKRQAEPVEARQARQQPARRATQANVDQETGEIQGSGDNWEPTAEELAEIQARELAESGGFGNVD